MTDLDLIVDLHKNSERQGPGSKEETLRALDIINLSEDEEVKIADIGCGSGGQTITLALHTNSHITAVDLFPDFLDELEQKVAASGLEGKIQTLEQSMDKLPFEEEAFDIIWSEGAIYNIGFENGVKQWKSYLKKGGHLAVSEITWITNSRPKEIEDFWKSEYPEIDVASNKIKILEDNGYTLAGYFYLDQNSWIENYYKPLEERCTAFLERNKYADTAKAIVEEHRREMELYQSFKDYYSYGFYIARKN
jgi:cyclopropane fatty-acyl-phospholipid synthase-like methyltransferase